MYTAHGHQVPGTPVEGVRGPVARCGGPGLCRECGRGAWQFLSITIPKSQTGLNVEFNTFVRKPFTVEAVEVTEENIAAMQSLLGHFERKTTERLIFRWIVV